MAWIKIALLTIGTVNIRKLRLLLKEIGDITLKNEKSYWLLDIGSEVFIDYAMIISLLLEDKLSSILIVEGLLKFWNWHLRDLIA